MRGSLVIAVAGLLLVAGAVHAQWGDDASERRIEADTTPTETTIRSERTDRPQQDRVEFRFSTDTAVLETRYETRVNDTGNQTEQRQERSVELQFHELIEFHDTNDNDRYDGDDEVVSSWLMSQGSRETSEGLSNGSVVWEDLEEREVNEQGRQGIQVRATGSLTGLDVPPQLPPGAPQPSDNATIHAAITVFGGRDRFDWLGNDLGPTDARFNFTFDQYPYGDNGTQLALVFEVRGDQQMADQDAAIPAGSRGVAVTDEVGNRTVTLHVSWRETGRVDGRDSAVTTTELSGDNQTGQPTQGNARLFALTFERGDEIEQDFRSGAAIQTADRTFPPPTDDSPLAGTPGPGVLALIGAGLAAAAGLARSLRRR
jgi:hypothetical protein